MCHQEVATEIQRNWNSHRKAKSGHPLVTFYTDNCFIVNSVLRNWMMNATQLQRHLGGSEAHKCHVRSFETISISVVFILDGHMITPPDTDIIALHGPGSIYAGRGTRGPQCCFLMKVDSR
ncbi:hypothetical protein GOODEAATRI_015948 [Goodea atripinnis]|uniref:Uncharacterized protein n=1 Tax=Goodea atripinnis TaxID=208336 RepID=A0ABV0ML44_9TELE